MTLISILPAIGASLTFANIPDTYDDLVLNVAGVSHDAAVSAQLRIELSPDGTTFGAPVAVTPGYAASIAQYGAVTLAGYNGDCGAAAGSINNVPGDPGVKQYSSNFAWRCTGGISAIRLSWSVGEFDAGMVSLSGV